MPAAIGRNVSLRDMTTNQKVNAIVEAFNHYSENKALFDAVKNTAEDADRYLINSLDSEINTCLKSQLRFELGGVLSEPTEVEE